MSELRGSKETRSLFTWPRAVVAGGALLLAACGGPVNGSAEAPKSVPSTTAESPTRSSDTAQPPQGPPIEKTPPEEGPTSEIIFNYLGGNSKYIAVAQGPGDSAHDRKITGTYLDGEHHGVICQDSTDTRIRESQPGEEHRGPSPVWYKLDVPTGWEDQYVPAIYTDLAPGFPQPPEC